MSLEEISVSSGPSYRGGAFLTYFIYPYILGSDIASVRITSESGTLDEFLFEVTEDEFVCEYESESPACEDFASLAEISALGALTLDFTGDLGEIDSVTFPLAVYDPGAGQTGFPGVVFPTYLESGVPTNATIEWTLPPPWTDAVELGLEQLFSGTFTNEAVFFGAPVTQTTWTPSGLTNGTVYYLGISFFDLIVFPEIRTTTGGRGFEFVSGFEAFNETVFSVPEPGFGASIGASIAMFAALSRRRSRNRSA